MFANYFCVWDNMSVFPEQNIYFCMNRIKCNIITKIDVMLRAIMPVIKTYVHTHTRVLHC